jgi:hypothetical protein
MQIIEDEHASAIPARLRDRSKVHIEKILIALTLGVKRGRLVGFQKHGLGADRKELSISVVAVQAGYPNSTSEMSIMDMVRRAHEKRTKTDNFLSR